MAFFDVLAAAPQVESHSYSVDRTRRPPRASLPWPDGEPGLAALHRKSIGLPHRPSPHRQLMTPAFFAWQIAFWRQRVSEKGRPDSESSALRREMNVVAWLPVIRYRGTRAPSQNPSVVEPAWVLRQRSTGGHTSAVIDQTSTNSMPTGLSKTLQAST